MGQIICIASLKGGVGKTTTAVNLSTALAMAEKKSLLVDCDPQGYATSAMGINKAKLTDTIYHVMTGKALVERVIVNSGLECLNTLPARIELMRAEAELMSKPDKELILNKLLSGLKKVYDYIIIDTSPALSLFTVNAISAADSLLIPLQCEFHALEGIEHFLETVEILKKQFNPGVKISGLLLTMFEKEENISRCIGREVRNHFKNMVFKTIIPRSVHLRESAVYGKPLLLKDISAIGAQSYLNLAKELLSRNI
jgi:chromosome partitioning protein